jgi:ATP-binding cassette subfamily B protein
MKKLCKSFGLDGIIKKMGGYDTIIGQGGDRLSGGQEQRLCAVRALCRDFKILLLDEPTANLDEQNAEQVFKEIIRSVDEYKTVVAVAHSAKLIEKMDRVLVIIDGKLVEDGSPKVLGKDKNSEYYKIFNTNANQE